MTDNRRIDLHTHSSFSDDGELAPSAIIALAKDAGLDCVALSDHNSTAGVGEFLDAAGRAGIEAVPAVEIDCQLDGTGLHILGYFIDHADKRYAALDGEILDKKRGVSARRVESIRETGFVMDDARLAELSYKGIATGEAIAEAALEHPSNAGNPLLAPFREGGARSDNPFVNFYWDFCAPGKVGYVHIEYMSLAEAVALIRDTGGVPVIAHPGQSLKGCEGLIDAVIAHGVRGVEAYSNYHTREQAARWRGEAERLGVFATSGSDFHGRVKPAIFLGGHGAEEKGGEIAAALFAARK